MRQSPGCINIAQCRRLQVEPAARGLQNSRKAWHCQLSSSCKQANTVQNVSSSTIPSAVSYNDGVQCKSILVISGGVLCPFSVQALHNDTAQVLSNSSMVKAASAC
eukprot:365208-Chlamydomonas_euryale.AAC.6